MEELYDASLLLPLHRIKESNLIATYVHQLGPRLYHVTQLSAMLFYAMLCYAHTQRNISVGMV